MEPAKAALTLEELQAEADKFLAAGRRYWEVANRYGNFGAVIWIKDTNGFGCIFSRGEYVQQIVQNIERMGETTYFGGMNDV